MTQDITPLPNRLDSLWVATAAAVMVAALTNPTVSDPATVAANAADQLWLERFRRLAGGI